MDHTPAQNMRESIFPILRDILGELRAISAKLPGTVLRPASSPDWLTIKDAAVKVGVGEKIIRRAINSGLLPATNITASANRPTWRIAQTDFEEFMAARVAGQGAAPTQAGPKRRYKSRHFDDL